MADTLHDTVHDFEEAAKNRPVSKVTALLKDMVNQLEKEGEEDEEVYETMGCWCVTNEKSKTASIASAETEIETLTAEIESLTARSSMLNTDIAAAEKEIEKATEALETATSMREKESAEFAQFEKESLVNVNQLRAGLQALSKMHDAALLKAKTKVAAVDANKLEATDATESHGKWFNQFKSMDRFKELEEEAMTPTSIHQIDSIPKKYLTDVNEKCIQVEDMSFEEKAGFLQGSSKPVHKHIHHLPKSLALPSKIQSLLCKVFKGEGVDTSLLEANMDDSETSKTNEPASGEIFGILKQMQENFQTNLNQAEQAESKASAEFDELKAAKEKQIEASTDLVNEKKDELARTDEKNAEDKQIKEDTENALAADQAFLADLKERCASMDAEFEARTKGRQNEIEAVSKALAFLNSDAAHELFTRTFNPSFTQLSLSVNTQRKLLAAKVAKMLTKAAVKAGDTNLLKFARELAINPVFDKIKDKVDLMVDKLKKEQQDDVVKRDYCIGALNTNERDMGNKERDKEDFIALKATLKKDIEKLDMEIETLKNEVADLQVQLKRASDNREKENKEFQETVSDQRATAKLLQVSLKILSDFYNAALVQTNGNQKGQKSVAGQAPPPGFKSYEKNAASGGVMGMMQGIIDDAKAMEAESLHAEEVAQKDYEHFTKDTNTSIEQKTISIETKTSDKATAEQDLVQAQRDLDATLSALEHLINEEADLHKECDFLLKTFEESQAARNEEIDALKQANHIFDGASFQLFLQR